MMNLANIMLAKRSQSQRTHIIWLHLYEMSRLGQSIEMKECQELGNRREGCREWGMTANGMEFTFG